MYCLVHSSVWVIIKCCAEITLLCLFLLPKMYIILGKKSGQNKFSLLNWDMKILMVFHGEIELT